MQSLQKPGPGKMYRPFSAPAHKWMLRPSFKGAGLNLREEAPRALDNFICQAHQDRAAPDREAGKALDPQGLVRGFSFPRPEVS
jgi:hypothetical protein